MSEGETENASRSEKAQRIRLRFARGQEAAEIGHLDIARCWERALLDEGIAISYSNSKKPQPRLSLAAGLATGVTSDGELLDVILAQRCQPDTLLRRIRGKTPAGLEPLQAWEVGMGLPSLTSSVRWADYEVAIAMPDDAASAGEAIESLLAAESLPWEDTRGEKVRHYDLRAMVRDLRIVTNDNGALHLSMRLRCDAQGVGRPEQVVKALRLPEPSRIHRVRLILASASPAHDAWRRRGRYLS